MKSVLDGIISCKIILASVGFRFYSNFNEKSLNLSQKVIWCKQYIKKIVMATLWKINYKAAVRRSEVYCSNQRQEGMVTIWNYTGRTNIQSTSRCEVIGCIGELLWTMELRSRFLALGTSV